MKIIKTASGKQTIKISKSEWTSIGKKAGWIKNAQTGFYVNQKVKWPMHPDFGIGKIIHMHTDDRGNAIYKVQVDPSIGATDDYILARDFEIEKA